MSTTAREARAGSGALRRLGPTDADALLRLCSVEPLVDVSVASRVLTTGLDPWRLGGQVWGWEEAGSLVSACYVGGNLIPVQATTAAVVAFAREALRSGKRSASIVGDADTVAALWARLAPAWGPAREERLSQPLLVLDGPPAIAPDPLVRVTTEADLELLVPACEAMFREEVGAAPYAPGSAQHYHDAVADLVRTGRSYARVDDAGIVFKAEIGSVSRTACQVQGVWVAPRLRGSGLAAPGMAAVAALAQRAHAPAVSLYVNDYNAPALAAYARAGFRRVGTMATVLIT